MAVRKKHVSSTWSVAEARSRLDDVIDDAEDTGPQAVVMNADDLAVIAPVEE
jgi:prevent-host-death family protein